LRTLVARFLFLASVLIPPTVHAGETSLPDVAHALATEVRAPNDFAVIVSADSASHQAGVATRRLLRRTVGVPSSRVTHLSGRSASRFRRAVERAGVATGPAGTVWISVAGCDVNLDPAAGWRLTLAGGRKGAVENGEGPLEMGLAELVELAGAGGGSVVVLIDGMLASAVDDPIVALAAAGVPLEDPYVTIWASLANPREGPAQPTVPEGRFTYLVLGALRGWADGELDGVRDGRVTAAEARVFVRETLSAVGDATPSVIFAGGARVFTAARGLEIGPGNAVLAEALRAPQPSPRALENAEEEAVAVAAAAGPRVSPSWPGRARAASAARAASGTEELALQIEEEVIADWTYTPIEELAPPADLDWGTNIPLLDLFAYEMVRIDPPAGGSSREEGTPFTLGATEVTQELWQAVMGWNPVEARDQTTFRDSVIACGEFAGVDLVDESLPVYCVGFIEVVSFCNTLSEREGLSPAYWISGTIVGRNPEADGYRLPTDEEWKHAARAGTPNRYAGTDTESQVCRYGNVKDADAAAMFGWPSEGLPCGEGYPALAPVGSLAENGWGLHDMTGNVWEWVWGEISGGDEARGAPRNPNVLTGRRERLYRGGSWLDDHRYGRVDYLAHGPAHERGYIGFRLARNANDDPQTFGTDPDSLAVNLVP
jgi:formylglycine-generating enzyme required for sulfatase activity